MINYYHGDADAKLTSHELAMVAAFADHQMLAFSSDLHTVLLLIASL